MRRTWRITEIWQKTLYIAIGYAVFVPFFFGLRTWLLSGNSWHYALIGFVINLGYTLLGVAQELWPHDGHPPNLPVGMLNNALSLIIAFGYLNSSFRLRRHPELWSDRRRKDAERQ